MDILRQATTDRSHTLYSTQMKINCPNDSMIMNSQSDISDTTVSAKSLTKDNSNTTLPFWLSSSHSKFHINLTCMTDMHVE